MASSSRAGVRARVWLGAGVIAITSAAGSWTAPAGAQAPETIRQPVTDHADVLAEGDERAMVDDLASGRREGVDLHVLFVETTAATAATAYAEGVATASSMGGDDALLVVAFDDRTYALWTAPGLEVTPAEAEAILDQLVAPRLRSGDLAGVADAALEGIAQASGPGSAGIDIGRAFSVMLLLMVAGIVLFGFAVRRFFRRITVGGPILDLDQEAAAGVHVDVEALSARANSSLVRVDDALRDAEHEAGFAEAQFGEAEGASLRAALERARTELQEAFTLRQRLDDHVPEPLHERIAMLEAIVAHAGEAESIIQERLDRLEELRGLERDPARAVHELRARMAALRERIPAVRATSAQLSLSAPKVSDAVDGNLVEAEKRMAFAEERLTEAEPGVADAPSAAQSVRAAGAAVAQAEQLLDAVDDLSERVRVARERLPQELQEAEIALARAEDLVLSRRHVVGRTARTRLVEARRRFDRAQSLAESDPATAATEADAAERLADEAFERALEDSELGGPDVDAGGIRGFGWGLPLPIPFPIFGGGIGFGGTSWGHSGGGSVGGGSFGGSSVGGGRW